MNKVCWSLRIKSSRLLTGARNNVQIYVDNVMAIKSTERQGKCAPQDSCASDGHHDNVTGDDTRLRSQADAKSTPPAQTQCFSWLTLLSIGLTAWTRICDYPHFNVLTAETTQGLIPYCGPQRLLLRWNFNRGRPFSGNPRSQGLK